MKILFWSELYAPKIGGIETIVRLIAEALVRAGHEAAVICNREPATLAAEEVINGVRVFRLGVERALARKDLPAFAGACREMSRLRAEFQPDVEHVHTLGSLLVAFQMVRRGQPRPFAVSLHCTHDSLPGLVASGGAFLTTMREASRIVSLSEFLARHVRDLIPDVAARVQTEYHGIPFPNAEPSPLPMNPPVVVSYGRLVPEKGFDLLLDAFAIVHREFSEVRLILGGDGPERARLLERAAQLHLGDAVEFRGWIEPARVPAFVNEGTLVIMPSRYAEPFGLVALDAAQMARPVIATRNGGVPELVSEGETGWLVENDSAPALAAALRLALGDPARLQSLGTAARQRAAERFGFERYFQFHLDLYRRVQSAPISPA